MQTRCIVKGEAQRSPLFWRFSGFFFSQDSSLEVPQENLERLVILVVACRKWFEGGPIWTCPLACYRIGFGASARNQAKKKKNRKIVDFGLLRPPLLQNRKNLPKNWTIGSEIGFWGQFSSFSAIFFPFSGGGAWEAEFYIFLFFLVRAGGLKPML